MLNFFIHWRGEKYIVESGNLKQQSTNNIVIEDNLNKMKKERDNGSLEMKKIMQFLNYMSHLN